ncbi:aldo/keto reductase [Jiangella asiatica]|uniref:Aldo/keto reductase n=1 Tax=Jiangella asiatica TaxID=2530372 RepID=A0A4R5D8S8_9ACTN|nr:aldo/keto reductase [Jiangella asiatica]TDE09906.1 aldo/keto reductase [Jiangella asiatica]
MNPFERVPIGTTDVRVARFGLGTGPLGGWPAALPREVGVATVRRAWDAGIRYFDTAPLYGHGLSEGYVGAALAGEDRSAFTLSTKVGRVLVPGIDPESLFAGTPPVHAEFDFSAAAVERSLAGSRDRLGFDRVDIALVHDPDDHHDQVLAETYPLLDRLRADGVIGAVGLGMTRAEPLLRFATEASFDCMLLAGRYTLLEQDSLPLLEVALRRRISIVAAGVFNGGLLVAPGPDSTYDYAPAPAAVVARARRLDAVCARFGVPLRAAAIRFPYAHPAVACVVVGARSPAEVDDNLRLLRTPIPAELWSTLKDEGLLHPDAPVPDTEEVTS